MWAFDRLPKFARDWCNSEGASAIDVYNKLCEFQGDQEQLRRWIANMVVKHS